MSVLKYILLLYVFIIDCNGEFDLGQPVIKLINAILPFECQPEAVHLDTILPEANIDYSSLTVSGLSSGAFMANQYHFAYSSEVKGAGIFAGIPYSSYYGNFFEFPPGILRFVTGPQAIGPVVLVQVPFITTENSVLEDNVKSFVKSGWIDDTENLKGDRVYVFHGTKDKTVVPLYGRRLIEMYKDYGAIVKAKLDINATHTVPTDNFPTSIYDCDESFSSTLSGGISNCGYEGVFHMFKHLYGKHYKKPESSSATPTGKFSAFHQGPFTVSADAQKDFMDAKGFLYVPEYCQNPKHTCKIHIAFHGCLQAIYNDALCNNFALNQGYLQVADANHVVFLFPQAALVEVNLKLQSNLICWDFFGGVTKTAWFKNGPQMASVRKMSRVVAKLPLK